MYVKDFFDAVENEVLAQMKTLFPENLTKENAKIVGGLLAAEMDELGIIEKKEKRPPAKTPAELLKEIALGLSDYFADNGLTPYTRPEDAFFCVMSEDSRLICRLYKGRILEDIRTALKEGYSPEEIVDIEIQRLVPTVEQYLEDTKEVPKEVNKWRDYAYAKDHILPVLLPRSMVSDSVYWEELDDTLPLKDVVLAYTVFENGHTMLATRDLMTQWTKSATISVIRENAVKMLYRDVHLSCMGHYANSPTEPRELEMHIPGYPYGASAILISKYLLDSLYPDRHFVLLPSSSKELLLFSMGSEWLSEEDVQQYQNLHQTLQKKFHENPKEFGDVPLLGKDSILFYAGKEHELLSVKGYLEAKEREQAQEEYMR